MNTKNLLLNISAASEEELGWFTEAWVRQVLQDYAHGASPQSICTTCVKSHLCESNVDVGTKLEELKQQVESLRKSIDKAMSILTIELLSKD